MHTETAVGKPIVIRPVKSNGNRFCGPAAISAVTGIGTAEASKLIRSCNGKASVMGTSTGEMRQALRLMGIEMRALPDRYGPKKPSSEVKGWGWNRKTLAAWLRDTKEIRTWGRAFLLAAGNHWQIVSGRRYVCGITKSIVSIRAEKVKRRAQVTEVWELVRVSKPSPDTKAILAPEKTKSCPIVSKAKRLAKRHDIEIDPHHDGEWWVYPPASIEDEHDPYYNDHLTMGARHLLERVEEYVKML